MYIDQFKSKLNQKLNLEMCLMARLYNFNQKLNYGVRNITFLFSFSFYNSV